ncbi:MAG: 16S rRNA (guanine(966)-N(2))-methyltransferase RsmD [Planctomycetota bacterium]
MAAMRIIAGAFRGRRLLAPAGRETRPMLDRVREALFGTLAPWLEGARVLDLFAGTGSLGLEALSRGAARVRFVERAPAALLRQNVAALGVEERATVVEGDALDRREWGEGEPYDVVLLDPPYPLLLDPTSRRAVLAAVESLAARHLAPEGIVVLHAPRGELDRPDFPPCLALAERRYGTNTLWYAQRRGESEA